MSISYTYEIVNVDEQSRSMRVLYHSEGRDSVLMGARLPFAGESLESIVHMYSPVRMWEEKETEVVVPEVGKTGSFVPTVLDTSLASVKDRKLKELAYYRYVNEVSGVSVLGLMFKTDRESRANLINTYTLLKNGIINSVAWKASNDQWIDLSLSQVENIVQTINNHVQNSFNLEKQLAEQVSNATTVAEVEAIKWPI